MRLLIAALAAFVLCAAAPEEDLAARLAREALAFAEAQCGGDAEHYTLRVLKVPPAPPLKGGPLRVEPSHLSKKTPSGVFFVALRLYAGDRLAGTVRVDLEGRWRGTLLRSRTVLARRSVPRLEDLEEVAFEGAPPPGAVSSLPEGLRLRHALPAGRFLLQGDLEPIPLVSPGDRVGLTLRSGSLSIRAEGIARSGGALGERVRVELQGRRQIQATVLGPGEVDVQWSR